MNEEALAHWGAVALEEEGVEKKDET